jgi:hypothetical protein
LSAEKVIFRLLSTNAPLNAVVPATRIFAGFIDLESVLPAIAYNHVSTFENTTIDANSLYALVTTRIQVTIAAKDYPTVKSVLELVRKACNYQRGTINGVIVSSIVREQAGADFRDDEAGIFYQTIDFKVTYHELN